LLEVEQKKHQMSSV